MFTMSKAQSAGQAASYHSEDNYHIKDGITEKGQWRGKGAEKLGLEGEIDQKSWVEVLNGYAPGSLDRGQIKTLETLNKQADKLTARAIEISEMADSPEKTKLQEAIQSEIKQYNTQRLTFHKDVKTGGLYSEVQALNKLIAENEKNIVTDKKLLETGASDIIASIQDKRGELTRSVIAGNAGARDQLASVNQLEDKILSGKSVGKGDLSRAGLATDLKTLKFKEATTQSGKTFQAIDFKEMGRDKIGGEKLTLSDDILALKSKATELRKECDALLKSENGGQLVRDGKNEQGVNYHRAGFDTTLSAPKTISIMAEEAGDKQLIAINTKATETTFNLMEKYLSQAQKVEGSSGNLISGQFTHYTARAAEKDSAPDPQLHTHNFIMNLTQDDTGKWRSIEPDPIFKNQKPLGQIYQNELANRIRNETDYGLTWKNSGSNMTVEIKGVSEELKALRSGRTKQIETLTAAKEKALGRPLTPAEKDDITMTSRVTKGEQNVDELSEFWKKSREEIGQSAETLRESTRGQKHDKTIASSAEDAVRIAVTTLSEKQAVFSELELLSEAAKASQGIAGTAELQQAILENTKTTAQDLHNETETFVLGIEGGQQIYASAKMLSAEANIQQAVRDGKGRGALMTSEEFEKASEKVEENKKIEAQKSGKEHFSLTEGQKEILTHITTSPDQFIGVLGDAGVGKTTSLERLAQTVEILKDTLGDKFEIHGLAPTNLAASTIEKDSGIASRTIDSFIHRPTEPTEGKQQVYLVDESSMLDTVKMAKLTEIAQKNGAKMVYIGDNKQHKPVGAGSQFDSLEKSGEMSFAYATESMRHQTEMTREIAAKFKNIDTLHKGLDILESNNRLIQIDNPVELRSAMVTNLSAHFQEAHQASHLPREERPKEYREGMSDVAAIVDKNSDRQELNREIRSSLKELGVVGQKDHQVQTLDNKRLDHTAAQFSGNYEIGDTLTHKSGDGQVKRGTKNKVTAINRETNELKIGWHTKSGQYREKWISGNDAANFSAFAPVEKSFSAGDQVIFEGTDRKIGINNNDRASIKEIREDGKWVINRGGKEMELDPKEFPFVSHAYAITSHQSQGQSISKPHLLADTKNGMTNRASGYVGITRAKFDLFVYTDNREKLEELYKREQLKVNAGDKIDIGEFANLELNNNDKPQSLHVDDMPTAASTQESPIVEPSQNDKEMKIDPNMAFDSSTSQNHRHISDLAFAGSKGMKYDEATKSLGYNRQDMIRWKISRIQTAERKLNDYADKLSTRGFVDPKHELATAVELRVDEAKKSAESKGKPLSDAKIASLQETFMKQLIPGMELKEAYMAKLVDSGLATRDGDAYKPTTSTDKDRIQELSSATVSEKYGYTDTTSITIQTKHEIASRNAEKSNEAYFSAKEEGKDTAALQTQKIKNNITKAKTTLDMMTSRLLENHGLNLQEAKTSLAESVKEFAEKSGKADIADSMAASAVKKYENLQEKFIEDLHSKGLLVKDGDNYSIAPGKHADLAAYRQSDEHKHTSESLAHNTVGFRDDRSTATDKMAKMHKDLQETKNKPNYAAKHELRLQRAEEDLLANRSINLDDRRDWVMQNIAQGEQRDNMLEDIDRTAQYLDKQAENGFVRRAEDGTYSIEHGKHKEFAEYRAGENGQIHRSDTLSEQRIRDEKLIAQAKDKIESAKQNIDRLRSGVEALKRGEDVNLSPSEYLGPYNEIKFQSLLKLENQIMANKGIDFNLPADFKFESPEHKAAYDASVERSKERIADLVRDGILSQDKTVENKWDLNVSRETYAKYYNKDSTRDARAERAGAQWHKPSIPSANRDKEIDLMVDAKNEQQHIDKRIAQMRESAQQFNRQAQEHWNESNSIKRTSRGRSSHIQEAGKAGQMAKDLQGGIRYQQLVKQEAKMMEKGKIDLKSEREFVLKQPGSTKEMRQGFLASQARTQTMLNQMVRDGIVTRDKKNPDHYSLAVSRQEYAQYRQSDRAHNTKADIAQGAWNKALGDKLFEQGRANADAAMIAGGGWNPREAFSKVKNAGLLNKDTEEIFNRLTARYERLRAEGIVTKSGGEYRAVNVTQMRSFVASREDRKMAVHGEGENSQQYREMQKLKESTRGIVQGGMAKRLDQSIMRSTHVNLHVAGQDIIKSFHQADHMIGAKGFLGFAAAGVVGVIMGTTKTIGRGLAGAVYRMTKSVVNKSSESIKDSLDVNMSREVDTEKAVELMTGNDFRDRLEAAGRGENINEIQPKDKELNKNLAVDKEIEKDLDSTIDPKKEADKNEKDEEPKKSFEERLEEAAGGRKLDDDKETDAKEIEESKADKDEKSEREERNEEEERSSGGGKEMEREEELER
jgi:conjugative relaxase-like TrwC/TraI family protein